MRKIAARWFGDNPDLDRLAGILGEGVYRHCRDWDISIRKVTPEPRTSILGETYVLNTQKMDAWWKIVQNCQDGDELLLLDIDTVIVRPLDDIWLQDFDIALTYKDDRYPLNSGVVFLRISQQVKDFVTAWRDENLRLLAGQTLPWLGKYGGINQAALAATLWNDNAFARPCKILRLPCSAWNCDDSQWLTADPAKVRILHIKHVLRKVLLSPVTELWDAATK